MNDIINHYGKEHQLVKLIEELSELSHPVSRRILDGKWNKVQLLEELADVYVMLEQLKIIVCDELEIDMELLKEVLMDEAEYKIKRVRERMHNLS